MSSDKTVTGEIDATFSYASGRNVDTKIGKTRVHKADVDSSKVSGLRIEASDDRDPQTLDPGEKISFSFTDERGRLIEVEDASVGRSSSRSGDDDTGTLTAVGETAGGDEIALILSFDARSIDAGDAFYSRDSDAEKAGSGDESVTISALGAEPESDKDDDQRLSGNHKDDELEGGAGNDDVRGESGDDTLRGAGGNDTLSGASGKDVIDGGDGDDILEGGASGGGSLCGGRGNDTLWGGDGEDTLEGGAGDDQLDGGAGRCRSGDCLHRRGYERDPELGRQR